MSLYHDSNIKVAFFGRHEGDEVCMHGMQNVAANCLLTNLPKLLGIECPLQYNRVSY